MKGAEMNGKSVHERRWWILGVLCLSLLVIAIDNTILNVALPSIGRELHASESELQWIVDSYMLVFAGLLLAAGALGDRFGRKRSLLAGLTVFGVSSVAAAFSASSGVLIGSRAAMGLGAALIMPSTLSILTNAFPVAERAKAIGIWSSVWGIASSPARSAAARCSRASRGARSSSSTCRSRSSHWSRRTSSSRSRATRRRRRSTRAGHSSRSVR
jgi:MFS family permease